METRINIILPFTLALAFTSGASMVEAQDQPASGWPGVDLEAITGYTGFIDEEMLDHFVVGGAIRFALSPRVTAGAELLHMWGPPQDRDWVLMPTLAFDLRRGGPVVPYVIGGAGWLRHTDAVGTGLYSSSDWTYGGGIGIRMAVTARTYLTIEGRLGFEPLTRVTASFGWRLK